MARLTAGSHKSATREAQKREGTTMRLRGWAGAEARGNWVAAMDRAKAGGEKVGTDRAEEKRPTGQMREMKFLFFLTHFPFILKPVKNPF